MRRRRMFRAESGGLSPGLDVGALAPLVDMMTLLLVFLLRSYSTESAPMPPEGNFELAGTTSEAARASGSVVVLVSKDAVYIEGRRVIAVNYLPEDLLVREIYDPLLLMRGKKRIEVHADRSIPWGVLKRVLHTARTAGFEDLSLVAASTSSL